MFLSPPENHREESAFEKHLTAKVLVVCSWYILKINKINQYLIRILTQRRMTLQYVSNNPTVHPLITV